MQWAVSSPLQYSCTSVWQHVLPRAFASTTTTTTQPEKNITPPFSSPLLLHTTESRGWRGGSAAVQRAQTVLLLTQIPPLPRHTGLTLPPEQQDMDRFAAGCPWLIITHTHASGHTESVSSIKKFINQANTYFDDNKCNTYFCMFTYILIIIFII